ncbi:MAG: hypothetical protein LH477_09280 [Nocardioides sp.]|nr:hypothetical protein [Nocardioides sp.]
MAHHVILWHEVSAGIDDSIRIGFAFWDFTRSVGVMGPRLADPQSHPDDQPVPGPEGRVPDDWQTQLHE